MKILYIITKSNYGGAQKYVFELAETAKGAGHDVIVAYGGTGAKNAETGMLAKRVSDAEIRGVTITHFLRDVSVFSDIRAFFEVRRLIKHERPDVLHVSSSKAGAIGALAGRLRRVRKIIFTSHGLAYDESWRAWYERLLIQLVTWFTMVCAHHTILISSDTYERVKQMPFLKKKVHLIFNGVQPIIFLDKTEARNRLAPNLPEDTFWIGGIGELHTNKNWSAVIDALPCLPKSTHLCIIGEGEEKGNLLARAEKIGVTERVHLLGRHEEAAQYLKAFDIFVLPSIKEGLPYVLLEAGLASLPVIASNLPGVQDIITDKEAGALISPTADTLSGAIKALHDEPETRKAYGEKLHTAVTRKFAHESMITKTFALYAEH